MFLGGQWYSIALPSRGCRRAEQRLARRGDPAAPILEPLLGIGDPADGQAHRFVGGIRGTDELERLVRASGGGRVFDVSRESWPT